MSLLINSNILLINMRYVETVSFMYSISHLSVLSNIGDLFTKVNEMHAQDQELLLRQLLC